MMKNGRTFRMDCALVHRGIREFDHILPGQMRQIFIKSILLALLPFITTAITAGFIDELIQNQKIQRIPAAPFAGLFAIFALNIWIAKVNSRTAVGYQRLFSSHEIALTDKTYRLAYEELEKSTVRQLRDEVSGSINLSGAGMASLYWDMECICNHAAIVLAAFGISIKYISELIRWDLYLNHHLKESAVFTAAVLFLVTACSFISCKASSKKFDAAFETFLNGSKYISYGDFYTKSYLLDEDAALDARIYEPDNLILSECQTKCYEHFAAGKEKEIKAANLCDGIRLANFCVCGCVIYLAVGRMAMKGAIGAGSILMMYAAVTMIIESISHIAQTVTDLRNNNEHLIRFFRYMDMPEEKNEACTNQKLAFEELEIRNVSFKYPENDNYALENINLKLHKGDRLAIVGENGSGKTTLIKLICRLYQPTFGTIYLNGTNIAAIPFQEYISCIATVFQDFSLFPFSLAENVAASKKYEEEKVQAALEQVGLGAKAAHFNNGIEQVISADFDETGTNLSGGEQQMVAIARAIYKDAELMILDEPTAALDPYAEYEIYKHFSEITDKKTLISISHRLSSCRMCDRILVMEDGKILQDGSHDELVQKKNGKYYELWSAQAQYYT